MLWETIDYSMGRQQQKQAEQSPDKTVFSGSSGVQLFVVFLKKKTEGRESGADCQGKDKKEKGRMEIPYSLAYIIQHPASRQPGFFCLRYVIPDRQIMSFAAEFESASAGGFFF